MAAPATPLSPEEKRQRRLLTTVIGLNVTTLLMLITGMTLGGFALMAKVNVPKPKPDPRALPGTILPVSDQIFNLGEPNRYLKGTFQIELNTEGMKEAEVGPFLDEVRRRMPMIQDLIITDLSGKTYREVATPQGKEQLKEELKLKINQMLVLGEVKEVMLTSFAAQ